MRPAASAAARRAARAPPGPPGRPARRARRRPFFRALPAGRARPPPPPRFPAKLYDLVDSHSNVPEDEAIVSWCENGLAFIVRDLTRFCEEVLPAHFCHNKWASFIRQLNLYGFRRITQGASSGAYWHKFFQRGEPHLLRGITRSRRQGSGSSAANRSGTNDDARPPPAPPAAAPAPRDAYDYDDGRGRGGGAAHHGAWSSTVAPMHSGVPLPAMSVLPQLPPAPVISDEALLHELDTLVQQQRQSQRFDERSGGGGSREADVAAMPPPPQRAGSGELLNSGSGGSLSKYLAPGDGGGGIRKRLASHQSIHSVGSFDNGQMTEIGGHGPDRQRGKHGSGGDLAGAGGGGFRVARRTNSKSSLASDDWDLNIADVDSLNLDDWRWSESQNGPALSSFGGRQGGDFLRSSGGAGGMGGGRTHSGNSLGGLADLQQGLPLTDLPRSRSGEGLLAQPMLNANDPRVKNDPLYTQRGLSSH